MTTVFFVHFLSDRHKSLFHCLSYLMVRKSKISFLVHILCDILFRKLSYILSNKQLNCTNKELLSYWEMFSPLLKQQVYLFHLLCKTLKLTTQSLMRYWNQLKFCTRYTWKLFLLWLQLVFLLSWGDILNFYNL